MGAGATRDPAASSGLDSVKAPLSPGITVSHMTPAKTWRFWLVGLIIVLWGLQVLWLIWHFGPEARDLAQRAASGSLGGAIRQEEPLYRWATALQAIIPESAAYVFLDDYAAGKEIEVRYYLAPRRHILLSPEVPASFLFYALHQERAAFLLIREPQTPLGPGARAAMHSPAFHRVDLPGPGLVFRVEASRLRWGFYD
jgi:hypothetical protein